MRPPVESVSMRQLRSMGPVALRSGGYRAAPRRGKGRGHGQRGWLKDRFGLPWQVVPAQFMEMVYDPDPEKVGRMTVTTSTKRKLDIAEFRAAFGG